MKINEAEEKICPFLNNNDHTLIHMRRCVHFNCMAWKCSKQYDYKVFSSPDKKIIKKLESDGYKIFEEPTDHPNTIRLRKELPLEEQEGYCSLI